MTKTARKPKLTRTEKLLLSARRNPSPTCHDARQGNLIDYISNRQKLLQAFANLDRAITETMKEE
jgi:hypothetical protein